MMMGIDMNRNGSMPAKSGTDVKVGDVKQLVCCNYNFRLLEPRDKALTVVCIFIRKRNWIVNNVKWVAVTAACMHYSECFATIINHFEILFYIAGN